MNSFLYFFCAMQHDEFGTKYINGTVTCTSEVKTEDEFGRVRDEVLERYGFNPKQSVMTAFNKV